MRSLPIISRRTLPAILAGGDEKDFPDFTIYSPEKVLDRKKTVTGIDVIVLDLPGCEDVEGIIDAIRKSPGSQDIIVLVEPNTLPHLYPLKVLGVTVFLKSPLEPDTFEEARQALRNDRKFMDPALSDSIVEYFLE